MTFGSSSSARMETSFKKPINLEIGRKKPPNRTLKGFFLVVAVGHIHPTTSSDDDTTVICIFFTSTFIRSV
uniref:Uncharacterized protein n=1 Tax=Romanomermis culicivorax TaxID=13658 RepID=A0A915KSK1_ROMCU